MVGEMPSLMSRPSACLPACLLACLLACLPPCRSSAGFLLAYAVYPVIPISHLFSVEYGYTTVSFGGSDFATAHSKVVSPPPTLRDNGDSADMILLGARWSHRPIEVEEPFAEGDRGGLLSSIAFARRQRWLFFPRGLFVCYTTRKRVARLIQLCSSAVSHLAVDGLMCSSEVTIVTPYSFLHIPDPLLSKSLVDG
ncbi:hypothetical protein F4802DRAFT_570427, partial [Xylaria palmicola]